MSSRPSRRGGAPLRTFRFTSRSASSRSSGATPARGSPPASSWRTPKSATSGVFQLLRDINASGTAVVMATHDLDLVRQAPYRVIELQEGALVYDSAVDESRGQTVTP